MVKKAGTECISHQHRQKDRQKEGQIVKQSLDFGICRQRGYTQNDKLYIDRTLESSDTQEGYR